MVDSELLGLLTQRPRKRRSKRGTVCITACDASKSEFTKPLASSRCSVGGPLATNSRSQSCTSALVEGLSPSSDCSRSTVAADDTLTTWKTSRSRISDDVAAETSLSVGCCFH